MISTLYNRPNNKPRRKNRPSDKHPYKFRAVLILFVGLMSLGPFSAVHGQETSQPGSIQSYLESGEFEWLAMIQFHAYATPYENATFASNQFRVAQSRLGLKGTFADGYGFQLQYNASATPGFQGINIYKTFWQNKAELRVGNMKMLPNLDFFPTPDEDDFIGRNIGSNYFLGGQDIGIRGRVSHGPMKLWLGIYNGEGRSTNQDEKFLGVGRFQVEAKRWGVDMKVGTFVQAGYSDQVRIGLKRMFLVDGYRQSIGVDTRLESKKWFLAAEGIRSQLDLVVDKEVEFTSGFVTLGYTPSDINTFAVRWQRMDRTSSATLKHDATLGYKRALNDVIAVQVNVIGYMDADYQFEESELRLNIQLAF
ncbi:MAG TPA: hypothetical protein DEF03_00165 [Bacteroidetes bacterium]|nr:hypothetical protein [Bacteroidota bacterium]